ncbi:hypothetical protein K440DRAFT_400327 [Wilcoxina mikolae CBS 423.85]|nr:hypothetical protein K440DRAFT_400327 [Wilcoxina mikolae CBS 423.85]
MLFFMFMFFFGSGFDSLSRRRLGLERGRRREPFVPAMIMIESSRSHAWQPLWQTRMIESYERAMRLRLEWGEDEKSPLRAPTFLLSSPTPTAHSTHTSIWCYWKPIGEPSHITISRLK